MLAAACPHLRPRRGGRADCARELALGSGPGAGPAACRDGGGGGPARHRLCMGGRRGRGLRLLRSARPRGLALHVAGNRDALFSLCCCGGSAVRPLRREPGPFSIPCWLCGTAAG